MCSATTPYTCAKGTGMKNTSPGFTRSARVSSPAWRQNDEPRSWTALGVPVDPEVNRTNLGSSSKEGPSHAADPLHACSTERTPSTGQVAVMTFVAGEHSAASRQCASVDTMATAGWTRS